jgi:HK97 family phage portal protein
MLDGFYGYSTLLAGGRSLMLGRKIEDYERKLFSDQAMIRGVFSRPADKQPLTDEAFRRVKSQLKKLLARVVDENDPILLEDGITYKEIAMTADEANMGKALDSQIEMVCKLWRMPPHKAMHLTAVKYENLSTMEMVYVRDTLMPICRLIETRLGRTLLTPEERLNFSFEFDRDELSISDQTQETARIKMMAERGIISINEAREDQGYNPRPGGDVYILPVNTVLVDENGNVVATGTKSSANTDGEPPADDGEDTAPPKKSLRLVANN